MSELVELEGAEVGGAEDCFLLGGFGGGLTGGGESCTQVSSALDESSVVLRRLDLG